MNLKGEIHPHRKQLKGDAKFRNFNFDGFYQKQHISDKSRLYFHKKIPSSSENGKGFIHSSLLSLTTSWTTYISAALSSTDSYGDLGVQVYDGINI